jgi:hypothetical protein
MRAFMSSPWQIVLAYPRREVNAIDALRRHDRQALVDFGVVWGCLIAAALGRLLLRGRRRNNESTRHRSTARTKRVEICIEID